jgi:hypothetical protein
MNLIFTLVCLTIDRYLAVVKPLQHRTIMNRRTAYRMLVVVYFLSFVLAVVPILGKAKYTYHPGTNHCSPAWANSCGYAAAMTTIAFIIPIIGMLITYTRIFVTLRDKRVLMSKNSTSTLSSRDVGDPDSNSLGDFDDTSTDPSGDLQVRLTAQNTLAHSEDDVLEYDSEIGASLENLVHDDSTINRNAAEITACDTAGGSKYLVNVAVYSSGGEGLDENKGVSIRTDEEFSRQEETQKVNNEGSREMKDAVNDRANKLADKELVSGGVVGTNKPEMPRSEASNAEVVGREVTPDAPISSSDHDSDVFDSEESRTAENKHVSFQNSLKVYPSESKDKEESKKRLSNILPASRKAMQALVKRMKRQRAIRHEFKIARTGTILVVTFLLLWMPYVIAHLCFARDCRTMTFYSIATFLVYTNALANPIIYALTNRAVMEDIRGSMGRLCQSRQ